MTHMIHVEAPALKITEKVLNPPKHELTYTGVFTISSRKELLRDYIDESPLAVVSMELLEYMRDELNRLRNELDDKEDYIDSLKEAAKILIEAASMKEDEDPVCKRMKIDEAERKADRNDPF